MIRVQYCANTHLFLKSDPNLTKFSRVVLGLRAVNMRAPDFGKIKKPLNLANVVPIYFFKSFKDKAANCRPSVTPIVEHVNLQSLIDLNKGV